MGRRSLTALLAVALASAGLPLQAMPAVAVSPNVVISQVYGGGGNTGATYRNKYVELFNRGTTTLSLSGWSLQYASATGTGFFSGNSPFAFPIAASIAPGQYYLVQVGPTGANGAPLSVVPDATASTGLNPAQGSGKLIVANTTSGVACNGSAAQPCSAAQLAQIVDLVGYGSANFFEGASAAPALSSTTAAFRNNGGCSDTDNNGTDFAALAPAPRNTTSPLNPCPTGDAGPSVVFRAPAPGSTGVAVDSSVTVGFSEDVTLGPSWYAISRATSGAHTAALSGGPSVYVLDPDTSFASLEWCTVTVVAAQVTDQDTADPPDNMAGDDVFSFQTAEVFACGEPATPINDVQGSGAVSPLAGSSVTIEGVVIGDYQLTSEFRGFYLQEEDADADADPLTSEGIFVFHASTAVQAGDVVRVRGRATEFAGLTEIDTVSAILVCSSGSSVTPTAVSLPVADVGDLEAFEGMLVSFDQTLTVTEVFNLGHFGEAVLSGTGRQYIPTAVAAPGADALAVADANRRARIVLDDGNNLQNIDPTRYPQGGLSASNTLRVGDGLDGLTGVMDFRFGAYRIQPVGAIEFDHTNPRPASPEPVGGDLKVASFNVLNFFNGDGLGGGFPTARGASTALELERQLAKEVSALVALDADIVGLMELENDAPPNSAIEDLVAALNVAMGAGTYSFIDTGVIGTDAIKVALIYKPGSVSPVGAYQTIDSADDPRFIDTLNRPSLAQTFEDVLTGQRLTVVVNHLKSKSSSCASVGDPDAGDGQGNCNQTRTAAAEALVDWLASDPTASGDPDYLIIGDLNSYTYEDPIRALTSGGFTNLVAAFGGEAAYSYVFQGESGYLDHALASASLAVQVTGTTDWHINADEPAALDYNMEFKNDTQDVTFYDAGPNRSSDHDPVLVGIDLTPIAGTGGKLEGTPQWVGGVKTKLNVIATADEAKGRVSYEGDGRYYVSTILHSIVVDGADATVFGSFGSVEFRLDVHDGGSDREDTLRLRTSDGYDSGTLAQLRGNLTVWP